MSYLSSSASIPVSLLTLAVVAAVLWVVAPTLLAHGPISKTLLTAGVVANICAISFALVMLAGGVGDFEPLPARVVACYVAAATVFSFVLCTSDMSAGLKAIVGVAAPLTATIMVGAGWLFSHRAERPNKSF
jgi:hypothetical protein